MGVLFMVSVILTVCHSAVKFYDLVQSYRYIYMIQLGAFFTSFSVAERFLSENDEHFILGCIGFLLTILNLYLMFFKRRN